jgi:hypothetical protein
MFSDDDDDDDEVLLVTGRCSIVEDKRGRVI